ncbi:hypothetical protein M9458_007485, partial [Cirrhinus mrigala]
MDVQMAVFHCADGFLKQLMVTKLSQCQYALPLLVPDPFTQQIEFPLWTFRQINKSWKIRNNNNECIQTKMVYKVETPMVFFFRFGSVSLSKSQLMNSLINEKHDTFFHRNCPGSSRTRVLMDGVVEIAWFCPSGSYDDKFTECVAFCNLHSDAGEYELQLQILTEMASVNVVLVPRLDRDAKHAAKMQNLLKDVSKHSDITVDEEDDDDCRRGREAAQQMMSLLENKNLTEIKESFLPHQGKLWHQWCQKNKELHRPQGDEIEMDIYESCYSVNENKKDLQFHFSSLPRLAAEMMISGFPLELMDGDAAHVPVIWISAVLDQLIQKLGDQRVFVLSGKSTMLNAMFGLQFARSFHAAELAGRSTRHHDNELATFVIGLANLTLINILGENPSEMQDILQIVVQAFMRMKKNVSDITAGQKNMVGRRQLQTKLDEGTKLAAKEEKYNAEHFSDIIRFDIHNDVKYFTQLWEGNPPMAPPNPNYCENIKKLKTTIMSYASKTHGMMLKDFKDRIKDLWEALLNEQFVFSFRNSLEISLYRKLETEYSKWSWSLCSAMIETENKLHNKIENEAIHKVEETDLQRELKPTSEEVKKSMSEFFEKHEDKDILIQWKTSTESKIKELQENIVKETKRKLIEVLQQRDLKKKIDAQRKHHENTLYEKSKELALKLKDKANDEETLKKEFDMLWEHSVKNISNDTLAVKESDIMRDMREILSDIYKSVPVDYCREDREYKNMITIPSYYEYVIFRKSSNNCNEQDVKKSTLIPEDETQIRSLVLDVVQQTDKTIQSFQISEKGYNIRYIQELIGSIKKSVTEHQENKEKYDFKDEFFVDLSHFICKRANEKIADQHRMFRETNDLVIYVEKKKEEFYSIFQKYCQGETSAVIFGEIICQKLKEPIEQSVYKKTARDLTDEMKSNCESLNGNRSNLEKHILKTLAEEEDFDNYMDYVFYPRDHFKDFIRDEVSRYITDKFSVSVLPKMKENIKLLQQKIIKAAHESTEHVQVNSGDVGLWLKSFTQQLSDELIFSEKDLSGVKHNDVHDFNLLEDVLKKELILIMSDISSRFNRETFPVNLDNKDSPYELLIDHFCQATCTNTIENHDGDHSVLFHRNIGLNGDQYFHPNSSDDKFPWSDYRRAGGVYADWNITPDLSELPYWKWFVCRFQNDLEKYYSKTFEGS